MASHDIEVVVASQVGGTAPALTISQPTVRARRNQIIQWRCEDPFAILFGTKTPFAHAALASDGKPLTAKINKPGAGDPEQDRYKYSLVVAVGDTIAHLDPDIIVDDMY